MKCVICGKEYDPEVTPKRFEWEDWGLVERHHHLAGSWLSFSTNLVTCEDCTKTRCKAMLADALKDFP